MAFGSIRLVLLALLAMGAAAGPSPLARAAAETPAEGIARALTTPTRSFRQTLFIARPAEAVWAALTEKALVDRYYLAPLGPDRLTLGGEIFYGDAENRVITGRVLALEAPRRFAHSFRFAHAAGEAETVVRYEIEPLGAMSALHLSHEGFPEGSQSYDDVAGGWPVVLSGLKTLLETGQTLPWPR